MRTAMHLLMAPKREWGWRYVLIHNNRRPKTVAGRIEMFSKHDQIQGYDDELLAAVKPEEGRTGAPHAP